MRKSQLSDRFLAVFDYHLVLAVFDSGDGATKCNRTSGLGLEPQGNALDDVRERNERVSTTPAH
jgi:hypothetical protein